MRTHRRISPADVGVALVVVLLYATFSVAQLERAREVADRVKCSSNLRQIGQAILLYANDNKGAYPRTLMNLDDPKPTWGTPYEGNEKLGAQPNGAAADQFDPKFSAVLPANNDVSAAIFLLLRTQDITSDVFVCPSTGNDRWDYGGGTNAPINWSNWPGTKAMRDHLSYSMQDPYPTRDAVANGWKWNSTLGAEFAIAADLNPGGQRMLKLTARSPQGGMAWGNSPNHDRDGQNVLYGDGHVAFESNPFVGVMRDNIYTFGPSGEKGGGDGIVGPSVDANDSILLPTAEALGVTDKDGKLTEEARRKQEGFAYNPPPAAKDVAAMQQKFAGTFTRDDGKGHALKLVITGDKLTFTRDGQTTETPYHVANLIEKGANLSIERAGGLQSDTIAVWPDGNVLFIAGDVQLAGLWMKQ